MQKHIANPPQHGGFVIPKRRYKYAKQRLACRRNASSGIAKQANSLKM